MHLLDSDKHTRRAFLRRSGQLALTGTALPFALNLAAMGEAAAFDATDYKALVCVFLYGGNDYANTVVTYDDASYNQYHTIRGGGAGQTAGGIALAKSALGATLLNPSTPLPGGRQYALHPSQPLPVSQASKNFLAIPVIDDMVLSDWKMEEGNPRRVVEAAAGSSPAAPLVE